MLYDVFGIDDNHYEVRPHREPVAQIEADDEEQAVRLVGEHCKVTDDDKLELDMLDAEAVEINEVLENYYRCNEEGRRQIAIVAKMAATTFPEGGNVVLFKKRQ